MKRQAWKLSKSKLNHDLQRPVTNHEGYVNREAAEHRQSAKSKISHGIEHLNFLWVDDCLMQANSDYLLNYHGYEENNSVFCMFSAVCCCITSDESGVTMFADLIQHYIFFWQFPANPWRTWAKLCLMQANSECITYVTWFRGEQRWL